MKRPRRTREYPQGLHANWVDYAALGEACEDNTSLQTQSNDCNSSVAPYGQYRHCPGGLAVVTRQGMSDASSSRARALPLHPTFLALQRDCIHCRTPCVANTLDDIQP